MNTGKIIFQCLGILVLMAFLVACTPATPQTPIPAATIEVRNIVENEIVIGQITQKKSFNQCESDSSVSATIQFSETSGQTSQKALTLSEGGGGEIGIDKFAEIKLEGSIQEHYAVTKQEAQGSQESITIEVPARTRQEYTIIWKETRRTGAIEYLENGMPKFINFNYRTGVEFDSSSVRNIDCSAPTETPMPTFTPLPIITPEAATIPTSVPRLLTLKDACISSQTWTPVSTDTDAFSHVSTKPDGCYSMEALGIFADSAGLLHLNLREKKSNTISGIHTPINDNSVIEFNIFVNSMHLTYEGNPVTINFAVAPGNDLMTAKNAARFKLQVETTGRKPNILFIMADTNEYTGIPVEGQHYEYGRTYSIRFELIGNSMKVFINNRKMDEDLLIPNGQKAFYIGYDVPVVAGADVQVSGLTVDGISK